MPKGSRTGHRFYRRQRASRLRLAAMNHEPCAFCGKAIDYALAWPDPQSAVTDHAWPVNRGGANYGPAVELRPAHAKCNRMAGDRWGATDDPVPLSEPKPVTFFESSSIRERPSS